MKQRIGNMWDSKNDVILVTTNSVLNCQQELVMGAGSAFQARQKYPQIARLLGAEIKRRNTDQRCTYGTIIFEEFPVGAFQTKGHYRYGSTLQYIEISTSSLCEWCRENPLKTVSLPFPGVGLGGLTLESVYPIIDRLPDNVTIWVNEIRVGLRFQCGNHTLIVVNEMKKDLWKCFNVNASCNVLFSSSSILSLVNY
jgi:hypothetical protein